jgi:EAL domain-containing protein (putative c-di-GMP-specific phosphodiesterase class I)
MVGQRLVAATRAGDTVARLGGDEFAVIVEETEPAEASRAADRILQALAEPFDLGGRQTTVRASIGIAIHDVDGGDADELLRRADIAMYAAKARGGDGHAMYEARLYEATVARMEAKADLQGALERGELRVAYQPIVDMESGSILGAEALMRWEHPERGPIPPSEFIPLAEESGLIIELGRWILETACRQTREWQRLSGRADLTISVNLSGRQIADADLVGDVGRVLATTGLEPACLTLEITETTLVRDVETTIAAFRALKALGVRLAIDDFGTGYSSLSYLRQFPIDVLKIDRSFVASLDEGNDSSALVRSILNLSATLRLDTVAEGIETQEQRHALESLGATRGQGYLFARPMAPTRWVVCWRSVPARSPGWPSAPREKLPRHIGTRPAPDLRPGAVRRPFPAPRGSIMTSTTDAPARTLPSTRLMLLGVAVAAVVAVAASVILLRPAAAGPTRTIALQTLNASGVTGTVSFTDLGGRTRVDISVDPAGNADMPAHIHPGTCANLTPQPKFPLENVRAGSSTTVVPAPINDLFVGSLAVNIHKSNDDLKTYTACVDIR